MNRRSILALLLLFALLVGLSGCLESGGGDYSAPTALLEMDPVNDSKVAERALGNPPTNEHLERLTREGSVVTTDAPPELGPNDRRFVYDGTVYEYATENLGVVGTRYTVEVTRPDDSMAEYQWNTLPDADREALDSLIDPSGPGVAGPARYVGQEQNASVFVDHAGESVTVARDTQTVAVTLRDPAPIRRYRTTARPVESAATAGQRLRSEYGFELSGLSPSEREIVAEAIETGNYRVNTTEDPSAAFRSLVERLEPHEPIGVRTSETESDREYVLRYGGEQYWVHLYVNEERNDGGS